MKLGADVFNALDITENKTIFEELKFGIGDGNLHYYFFNWRCPEVLPEKVCASTCEHVKFRFSDPFILLWLKIAKANLIPPH